MSRQTTASGPVVLTSIGVAVVVFIAAYLLTTWFTYKDAFAEHADPSLRIQEAVIERITSIWDDSPDPLPESIAQGR